MPQGAGNLLILAIPFLLLAFMMWSQRKRQQQAQAMQNSLAEGDEIVTTSGLFGTIVSMDDVALRLQIAEGVVVRWDRRAVASKVSDHDLPAPPDPTPVESDAIEPKAP